MSKTIKTLIVLIIIFLLGIMAKDIVNGSGSQSHYGEIEDPVQEDVIGESFVKIESGGNTYKLTKKASYNIEAVVKSKKKYTRDLSSVISNYDFALAWGELNKPDIDEHIDYSQSGRWYYYKYDSGTPVAKAYIGQHSANVHLIPADELVAKQISNVGVNDLVELEGYLVYVKGDNFTWNSSLTRNDTGDGACEVLYVEKISVK
jgi:hypothetical protein